jgi:acyl transferase domain-containing protein/enoyl-CoA hydratase/carnithine racemase/NAD(P)-dependent dehydrogenase (short-subunit alcohol dehydrogenase family)/acyl carrier protein
MKQELAKIYRELSAGKLSQPEALDRIKALKQPQANKPADTLLAAPVWEPCAPPALPQDAAPAYAQHHIIACDLTHAVTAALESLIPKSRCATVQTARSGNRSGNISEAYAGVALACFETIRQILKDKTPGRSFVQLVVAERDDAQLFAGLSGMIETAALENPGVVGQIVFVRPDIAAADLAQRLRTERNNPQDRVVRYTGAARLARRWRLIDDAAARFAGPCAFKEHGVYLITGGLGGLGLLLANEMLHRTAGTKVVLTGRAAAAGAKRTALEFLQKTGRVEYRQVDVTDAGEVERLLSSIVEQYGQLNGIVHSAGIVRDDFILKKSSAQFSDVLQPKVAGTEHLDLASRAMELDFFVLFSSIASWTGNVGQADYAAANGFMDQFAGYRNALVAAGKRTGKTLAIAWPHWLEGGMNIDPTSMALLQQRTGLRSLETEEGMAAFHRCLALPQSMVMVMRGDTASMRRALEAERTIRREIRPETSPVANRGAAADATKDVGDLVAKTRAFLRKEFSAILKIPVHKIETRAALENYGIDSILAMNLTNQLEATFGALPKTLFFEYQTIDELADYFVRSHADKLDGLFATATSTIAKAAPAKPAGSSSAPPAAVAMQGQRAGRRNRQRYPIAPASAQPQPQRPVNEPIAIVGLSGRYPEARDLEEFWRNLRDGKDCIVEVPKERWDWRQYYSEDKTKEGAHYSKWGGFIEGVDEFDPRFFNIAPREARSIDPQERLFLQHAWMAIEDAGYTRASLQIPNQEGAVGLAGQVGVYAGVMYGEYNLSGSLASIANRVSYFLNLHGPSLTLDTMCSSSLTAIHLACQDLRLGRTGLALAGGVNVSIHPNKYAMLSGGQFISSDGHCQSFGEGGGGYIPGEGVGVAVLKRLSEAERDGNHIYGVIRGSALNHGGKTNGYTVPNPQAQAEVIRRALVEAEVDPRHVSYIEAHGTGTKLGDPIEIAALSKAFYEGAQSSSQEVGFCLIGSAKSNIGHCESAAGIAGVTKVLLQMKHASIVPSLHSSKLNPHIDFEATPFVVNQTLRAWEQPELDGRRLPRIAGISAFGAGGSNAHVVVEEYRAPEASIATVHAQVAVPLSARTPEQLEQRVRDLLEFIERSERPIELRAMAYTLQVGREAMEERAAFLAISIEDLSAKLKSFLTGDKGDDMGGDIHCAQVKQHKEALSLFAADPHFQNTIEQWIEDRKLPNLVELWVKGLDLDWRRLVDDSGAPRLMSLPTYPFARKRYWVEPSAVAAATAAAVQQTTLLHPLVHANKSNLLQQSYASSFSGSESFLDQGPTAGQKALPPLLALEMIRAAVELASPQRSESGLWELRETVWGEPLAVAGTRSIGIALFPRADDAVDVEIYSGTGTGDGADDSVHCQGHAVFCRLPAPARVDVARLKAAMWAQPERCHAGVSGFYQGDQQALAELRMPARSDQDQAEYLLHPELLKLVSQLLDGSTGQSLSPVSLERLRIVFACPENAVAWLRYSSSSAVDVDVCDEQGNVCVQMSGLRCESVAQSATVAPADVRAALVPEPVDVAVVAEPLSVQVTAPAQPRTQAVGPREIVLAPASPRGSELESEAEFEPVSKKPIGVRLLASADVPPRPAAAKATVALSVLSARPSSFAVAQGASRPVRLFELGEGVFSIDMEIAFSDAAIEALLQALNRVRNDASLKVLLLTGRHADSWRGDRDACNAAIERRLFGAVAAFPCPVVAVVQGDAAGAGLLLASVCDFMVCSEDGQVGFTDIAAGILPSAGEERFFRERLGDAVADDLLYRSTRCSGRQLRDKGWACSVAPSAQVEANAKRFAADLSRKSQLALGLLKTHLSRHLCPLVEALAAADVLHAVPRAAQEAVDGAPDSTLVLKLGAGREAYNLQALIADLKLAFDRVGAASEYKSVVLAGAPGSFLLRTDEAIDCAGVAELKDLVRSCPVPVIAAFESDADGQDWLFGLFCDAVVYSNGGRYCASALWTAPSLVREVAALCAQRLGSSFGQEVCLTEGSYSGAQLRARIGALAVVDGDQVMPQALRLAAFWDAWPRATVAAWKQAQTAHLQRLLEAMPEVLPEAQALEGGCAVANDPSAPTAISAPSAIALDSTVVSVTAHPDGVVVVGMRDREAKNMFSEALVSGLKEAFAHIAQTPAYKTVVLTGYDNYFATGGTKETLLAIQQGQAQFTDEKVFQLPMECALPVIAAIQGHGIGGGWSFGMFSDLVLLSEESRYLSPYMGYGFTPGAGSTLMFPAKIGLDLARETLMGAQEISGHALKERGVQLQVLPRRDVVEAAIALAARMARQPRERLIGLKQLWTHALRQSCEDTYRREVEMHERTFVKNAETLATIQTKFAAESARSAQAQVAAAQVAKIEHPASSIVGKLKVMLAQELFLKPEEIDEDTQFIDLGLDSITGVTWIRKINAHYGTDIEATKVYSHPTLQQLSRLVASEATLASVNESAPAPVSITAAIAPRAAIRVQAASAPVAVVSSLGDRANLDSVIAKLKAMLAIELLLRPDEIEETAQFIDMGLDSITGVTWVRKINEHYGTDIEATKVYSHPTLQQIGRLVKQEAEKAGTLAKPAPATPVTAQAAAPAVARQPLPSAPAAPATQRVLASWRRQGGNASANARLAPQGETAGSLQSIARPIAVIGIAGQFPMAKNLDEFWTNLAEGRNCIAEVPDARWRTGDYFQAGAPTPGKTNSKWLGALDEYDLFDPLFFNISPTEAECMEPQQRVFLQACWHSIENAGYNPHSLSGSQCGVFVGCGPSDYHQVSREQQLSAQGFTGAASSILAARISYFLNLRGPCIAIETACSSSLVAIANACDSLNAGNSDQALAGGVYVMAGPAMHIMSSQAGMLSTDGRCFSFDQRANGFVPGEGVGVLMLKRLADAERDGDRIQAVIEGWGVNQDGKTNGITAPNEESQTRLLQSVYRKFDIDPAGIQLIEAHGTGTKLGDPIEIAGLKAAFKPFTDKSGYCALGSVKSNIGHCLTAAGVAGFIKLILALKHRSLPPTINYERRNEHIRLEGSPFYLNDTLQPWNVAHGEQRRAAISAFGFGGTNAHLVIAEHAPRVEVRPEVSIVEQDGKIVVPLSARTEQQLRQMAQDLLAYIRRCKEPLDLVELAYTLQLGRDPMGERLGFLVGSPEALSAKLEAYLAGSGGTDIDDVYQGQVKRHKEGMKLIAQDDEMRTMMVEKWLGQRRLSKLLDLWVKGLDLDWTLLYGEAKPRRIALPNYPFAKERYWLTAPDDGQQALQARAHREPRAVPPRATARTEIRPVLQDKVSYTHKWAEQPLPASATPAMHKTVLIVRTAACFGLESAIRAHYERNHYCRIVLVGLGDETRALARDEWLCGVGDPDGFRVCLQETDRIDALYFLASSEIPADAASADALKAGQESNEIALLRLVKYLKQNGKIDSKVDTYLLTLENHPIDCRPNRYWGAGVSGLGYSLAQGNHQFRVRNLDLSSEDLNGTRDGMRNSAALIAAITREPPSDRGEVFKLQQGRRYRHTFFRLDWDRTAPSAIKHDGVYVILGGSGIVGQIITRNLIEKYRANVVWLGRSAQDAGKIQDVLHAFSGFGDRLQYIQADALSEDSLRRAVAQIKEKHPRIHGAIFSGMVFGTENSIDQTTEAKFRSILEVKTLGSRAFYGALRDEPLDFMCFFSSGQAYSFSGAAKLSAYATGITFADSFVRSIRADSRYPVGTINWGFWKAAVRERIEKLDGVSTKSIDALDDQEGFECFERFVGELQHGRIRQVLCMRASREVEALMNCSQDQFVALASGNSASPVSLALESIEVSHQRIADLTAAQQRSGLNDWFARLLFCQLDRLIESAGIRMPQSVADIRGQCGIAGKYAPWLRQSFDMLAAEGLIAIDRAIDGDVVRLWNPPDSAATWAGWRSQKEEYVRDQDTKALAVLIDECLEKLPDILQGKILATDVIFPNSSVEKVGGLYKNNATADTFNEIVADTVLSYLRARLSLNPEARLRILEVGAGTGGTSAIVFSKLSPYKASVEQYCYTDLSKAFFFHAQTNYLPDHPYIVCRRLDIEQPIEEQGIEIGSYDLVIATNALHATKDIRNTLRHAKAALCKDGFIIVSEMCDSSLTTHLTFGLLDGWWLFEDAELRIPGCPGLYPETWQRVLEEEGFSSVLLPGKEAQALGNQVVIAQSDGVLRLGLRANKDQLRGAHCEEVRPEVAPREARRPQRNAAKPPRDVSVHIRGGILECLSATLKIPEDSIETDIAFSDYGIDSILGVNFIDQINGRFRIALNTAIIFEYSSIDRLSRYVVEMYGRQIEAGRLAEAVFEDEPLEPHRGLGPVSDPEPIQRSWSAARPETRAPGSSEIAIIGMSGKFPKADNVEQFWRNLIEGVDAVEELPAHYLDQNSAYSAVKQKGKTRCKWAGILADRDCFDPLFFSISPKEAVSMNPHQRLVMQESWSAIEDAGYNPKALSGSQTAIFTGAEPTGYIGDSFTGLSDAIIASRLSYALNFNGPALVVNTGCSSSAVAIHLACESLRSGESELVLAGGVNACLHQDVMVRLDQIDMLSPSGRCYTFDKAGDGTIISEGVGMIVLKRLDDAVASGDQIYATICGSGINQDGASNGITAPNGAAQEQLIINVYDRFGIDPEQISYIEAHGTGTKLGDPVETNALVRAFKKHSARIGWCAVGSAKSHIGHAAAAAGVIGIIKVLLSMQHRQLPKLLNFKHMNPLIQFDGSPFYITTETAEWKSPEDVPRMAAVNAFGHSGTNAHLVVKEYLPPAEHRRAPVAGTGGDVAIPLSAKSAEQLRQKCEDLLRFIRASAGSIDLDSMAYTLQVGRESMEERLGFTADSVDTLAEKLRAYLDGDANIDGAFRGRAMRNSDVVSSDGTESASRLLDLWAQGRTIDWNSPWLRRAKPGRMRLPGYPFAKERYWMASAFGARSTDKFAAGNDPAQIVDGEMIEDILNRIANDSLGTDEGINLLRAIV